MIKSVTVKAFAKINLSLDVLDRMDDGYHLIKTVMQQIDLADDIIVEPHGRAGMYAGYKISLDASGEGLPEKKEDNLAYKAAKLMAQTFCPQKNNKITIKLNKKIPASAGLAGGSSDAAAVILALCRLWDIDIGLKDLCRIGVNIGADVPFCIAGNAKNNPELGFYDDENASSAALAEGIGEQLTPVPSLKGWTLLVKPDISVPTSFVYEQLSVRNILPLRDNSAARPDTQELLEGMRNGNTKQIVKNMVNVLETVSLKEYPVVVYTKNKIKELCSAQRILMSGSGPTVFAFFADREDAADGFAKALSVFMPEAGHKYDVHLAQLL